MQAIPISLSGVWKIVLIALATILGIAVARASDPGDQQPAVGEPEQLVKDALVQEILGSNERRAELLKQAVAADADFAPAQWAQGKVQHAREWIDVDDAAQAMTEDARLVEYRARRDKAEDTEAAQLDLANWCHRRKLYEQARAHLFRVIELDPDNAEARERLGFVRIDGRWVSHEQVLAAAQKLSRDKDDLREWRKRIMRLRDRLTSRSAGVREVAIDELQSIDDPTACVAMELLLARHSEPVALLVVDALANIPEPEASETLARQAVASNWAVVRQAAAEQLQNRDMIEYVPALLADLELPVRTATQAMRLPNGGLFHRQMLLSEDRDNQLATVLDTRYRRFAMPNGNEADTVTRMVNDARNSTQLAQLGLAVENLSRARNNDVICDALRVSTQQDIENDAQSWWDWWDQENGVARSQKGQMVNYRDRVVDVLDAPISTGPDNTDTASQNVRSPRTGECLAAGTVVWTDRGPVSIEKVKVGDKVLGQDINSGAIGFKPVLAATERDPSELVVIQLDHEEIRASSGHPFWVAGEGWMLARELEAGMVLHGQQGGVSVLSVERGKTEATYNLIVEGYRTYFVGRDRVLGHDFTTREPNAHLVPGLAK